MGARRRKKVPRQNVPRRCYGRRESVPKQLEFEPRARWREGKNGGWEEDAFTIRARVAALLALFPTTNMVTKLLSSCVLRPSYAFVYNSTCVCIGAIDRRAYKSPRARGRVGLLAGCWLLRGTPALRCLC
jgi:hypothetical protein